MSRADDICKAVRDGEPLASVARRYGMKISTVGKITRSRGVFPIIEFSLDREAGRTEPPSRVSEENVFQARGRNYDERWARLEVGETLFIAGETARSMNGTVAYVGLLLRRKFVGINKDDGVEIVRVL